MVLVKFLFDILKATEELKEHTHIPFHLVFLPSAFLSRLEQKLLYSVLNLPEVNNTFRLHGKASLYYH